MKKIFFMALLGTANAFAAANVGLQISGRYSVDRPVAMLGYNHKACKAEGGRFTGGLCIMNGGGGKLDLKETAPGKFQVKIENTGTNAHMCEYEGLATQVNAVQLVTSDSDGCKINILFTDKDTVSIESNDQCNNYCGANMMIGEDDMKRAK